MVPAGVAVEGGVVVMPTCVAVGGDGGGDAHVCGCARWWLWWPRAWRWQTVMVVVPICVVVGSGRRWWWYPRVWQWQWHAVAGGAHVCGGGRR